MLAAVTLPLQYTSLAGRDTLLPDRGAERLRQGGVSFPE